MKLMTDIFHAYGMRLRGFSPGCQPKEGFVRRVDSEDKKYYDVLLYNRKLTFEEQKYYALDYLGLRLILVE